jgi:hypothetical protein
MTVIASGGGGAIEAGGGSLTAGVGGTGAGNGANADVSPRTNATAATSFGSGGGGANVVTNPSAGYGGLVVVKITGNYTATSTTGSPTRTVVGGNTYYAYTTAGTWNFTA